MSPARGHVIFGTILGIVIGGAIAIYFAVTPSRPKQCNEKFDADTCNNDCKCTWCDSQTSCYPIASAPCPSTITPSCTTDSDTSSYLRTVIFICSGAICSFISIGWCVYCCVIAGKVRSQETSFEVPQQLTQLPPPQPTFAQPQFGAQPQSFGGQPLMMTAVTGPDGQQQYVLTQVSPQIMSQLPPQQYVVTYQPMYM